MNVRDLINLLEEFPDDAPIVAATQPNWPLVERIAGARTLIGKDGLTVWLAMSQGEHNGSPYAPRAAWEEGDDEGCEWQDDEGYECARVATEWSTLIDEPVCEKHSDAAMRADEHRSRA